MDPKYQRAFLTFFLGVITLFFSLPKDAIAADNAANGIYMGGYGGTAYVDTMTIDDPFDGTTTIEFANNKLLKSYRVGGEIGYKADHLRGELEIGYLKGAMDTVTNANPMDSLKPLEGTLKILAFMLNGFYSADVFNSNITPYLGIGLGIGRVSNEFDSTAFDNHLQGRGYTFAYQGIVGLGYNWDDATLFLEYRCLRTGNVNITQKSTGKGAFKSSEKATVQSVDIGFNIHINS